MGAASSAYCALSAGSKPIEEVPKVIPAWQDGAWKVRYARLVMCIRVTSLAAVVCAGGIVLLTLVLGAADASYLRSGATRPLIGNQNKTTRAVFIAQNKRGSARHRGYDAARIVGGTVAPCDASVASIPADMFVHVKYPCEHARPVQAFHVFDRIDNVKSYAASTAQNPMPSPWFDAEITSNKAQLRQCGNRTCARIPHHANLNCRMHVDRTLTRRRPVLGLVGGNHMPVPHPLLEQLRNYTVLSETKVHGCRFFDQIDIAVAWKKAGKDKPGERFSNPLWFGIPTIGHSYHVSFADYKHAHPFLCTSEACVLTKVQAIANGTLVPAFRKLRDEVRADVNSVVARMYLDLFKRFRHRDAAFAS